MNNTDKICMSGNADGKKILGLPPTVQKVRLRMRPREPDLIYLKYATKIEVRHLKQVDEDSVRPSKYILGINRVISTASGDGGGRKKKDFWKP